ncbi:MAG TPA: long-chain fatty acid--CoA ligase [Thermoleophilaceae bacterium]|nr:long-chain fatty acid--CoA ligase [Thermoleophilaceae bacterium]
MNLASILTEAAERSPKKVAFKLDDVELSYAALNEGSARMAGMLRAAGVGPGDRVGIMLPNVPYFPVAYYGVLRLGGVVVPMNVLLKGREVRYYLEDPGAKALIAWNGFEEAAREGGEGLELETFVVTPGEFEQQLGAAEPVREAVDRNESDTAVILYTSGTTGSPKGAELTQANMLTNCRIVTESVIVVNEDDRLLGALPLFHSFGQTCTMNVAINARATVSLIPRFDPVKALEILERDQITIFEGVPTMYNAMLAVPDRDRYDVSSLRVCVSGGASLPVETLRAFEEAFGCKVLEGYGLSETSPVASFNHPHMAQKPGSIGTPIEGVEMKAIDDDGNEVAQGEPGEIAIRGHNVMKGYWQRPDATAEAIDGDGWFKTGDIATVDEEGYFFIVDRKKDMIIRGGYNVYPREIEEILYAHPAVLEAAVVGVPHDELGEEVGAAVVLNEGAEASAEEIREHCKAEVAAYKYPRHIWFLDELPKGPTGKILKREIETPAEVLKAG